MANQFEKLRKHGIYMRTYAWQASHWRVVRHVYYHFPPHPALKHAMIFLYCSWIFLYQSEYSVLDYPLRVTRVNTWRSLSCVKRFREECICQVPHLRVIIVCDWTVELCMGTKMSDCDLSYCGWGWSDLDSIGSAGGHGSPKCDTTRLATWLGYLALLSRPHGRQRSVKHRMILTDITSWKRVPRTMWYRRNYSVKPKLAKATHARKATPPMPVTMVYMPTELRVSGQLTISHQDFITIYRDKHQYRIMPYLKLMHD